MLVLGGGIMRAYDDIVIFRLLLRTIYAAVLGCALGATGMMVYAVFANGSMSGEAIWMGALFAPVLALFGLYMALPATAMLGIPSVLLLKHFGVGGLWRFATLSLLGGLSGPVVWNAINGTEAVGTDRMGAVVFGLTCGFACGWTTRGFALEA